ncbi:MAG: phospho-N-acetylmuramoyl-pentapeptide-transferase [Clostridia bacterium]|nr:phospho-N-acetylmuramoyl-pentapeptide-transferase [Clostridia bacterium]
MNKAAAISAAALLTFVLTAVSGKVIIPWLRKLKFGQEVSAFAPEAHQKKQGTPTMGGIMFIIASVAALALVVITDKIMGGDVLGEGSIIPGSLKTKFWAGLLMALGFAAIGFVDDYIKVVKHNNAGLSIIQKSVCQFVVMGGYLASLYSARATFIYVPFVGNVETGLFFWPLGFVVLYCTINSVNFTDGVDGLVSSVTATYAAAGIAVAVLRGYFGMALLPAALLGAVCGFLVWNRHPAKVFMGDSGSMFLGGLVVAAAYAADMPWLIALAGIIYVIEFASDIIQLSVLKATHGRKRVFKMAPIHHHFEKSGWSENKIVAVFTAVNAAGAVAAAMLVYFGR